MFTYQIKIEYLGTNFVGWQIQKNGLSIQEIIEKSLSRLVKNKIRIIGSGRTDSGVHANEQSAHFKTRNKIIDGKKLKLFHSMQRADDGCVLSTCEQFLLHIDMKKRKSSLPVSPVAQNLQNLSKKI